ncbi:MAG TPA: hypothetical protein V6C86_19470 [Oculatellaceae cyanobacterium]
MDNHEAVSDFVTAGLRVKGLRPFGDTSGDEPLIGRIVKINNWM